MPAANADLAVLVAELTAVADRGIDRCWQSKGRRQPVKMPRLLQAVRKVHPQLPEPEALELTLRAAIRQLGDERYGPGHPTWAWIAEVTFRFVEIPLPEEGGQVYANIQRALALKLGVSGSSRTFGRTYRSLFAAGWLKRSCGWKPARALPARTKRPLSLSRL